MFAKGTAPSHTLFIGVFVATSLLWNAQARSQYTVFHDEQQFVSALANAGLVSTSEGFENDDQWGLLELWDVPDVTSNGVTWRSLGSDLRLDYPTRRSGEWGLRPSPASVPLNGFLGQSSGPQSMFALGGWLRSDSTPRDAFLYLNGDRTNNVFDGSLGTAPTFFGVIATTAIQSFEWSTEEVAPGDNPKAIFLDDMTFGFNQAPINREPGLTWQSSAGGTFDAGGNWTGGAKPSVNQNAIFHLGAASAYHVDFNQSESLRQVIVSNDSVRFRLNNQTLSLTQPNITRESLIVGEAGGDLGALTIENGVLHGESAVIAHSVGSQGNLFIQNHATVNLNGQLRIGSGGSGRLEIGAGAQVASQYSAIGLFEGEGTAIVTGPGSTWNPGLVIDVGKGGTGTLTMSAGAQMTTTQMSVGTKLGNFLPSDSPGTGTVSLDGNGTRLTVNNLYVGNYGDGTFNVANSAVVDSTGRVAVGVNGGNGTMLVDGAGSHIGASVMSIGWGGNGALNAQNGATLNVNQFQVASDNGPMGGTGDVTLNDATLSVYNATVGQAGPASMRVFNGSSVTTTFASFGTGGDTTINVQGPTTSWNNLGGTFEIGRGDQVGSHYSSGAHLFTTTFIISDGATITSRGLSVGTTRKGIGILEIRGPGSRLDAGFSQSLNHFVGYEGDGTVNILGGGELLTANLFIGRFGIRNVLDGEVNVDGAGSRLAASGITYVGFNNNVTPYTPNSLFFSAGRLNVSGQATAEMPQLVIGDRRVSHGIVSVDGVGSRIFVGNSGVRIGHRENFSGLGYSFEGTGELNILHGGQLATSGNVIVHAGAVDLTDGTLQANRVELHGEFMGDGALVMLSGDGEIVADLFNIGGIVSPGHSPGAIRIAGDFQQENQASLSIELGGFAPGVEYDQLLVDGDVLLGGTLDVAFINGFQANAGDVFDVVRGNSIQLDNLLVSGPPGLSAYVVADTNGDWLRLSFASIPEPYGTWLWSAIAGIVVLYRRRRLNQMGLGGMR